ncbi:MAG: hypothetical protein AAF485_27400, partial [Chloroflexota bacterium]
MNLLTCTQNKLKKVIFASLIFLAMIINSLASAPFAEADSSFNVTSTADLSDINPGDGICQASNGQCTLRAAVEESNALPEFGLINVPAGNYLLNEQLVITDHTSIYGAGKGATVIDGQGLTEIVRMQSTRMLVCDTQNRSVISYTNSGQPNKNVVNFSGTTAQWHPTSIDIEPNGNVFVATSFRGVYQYRPNNSSAGKFASVYDFPNYPSDLNITDGVFAPYPEADYFVVDQNPNNEILRFDENNGSNIIQTIFGPQLVIPDSVAFYDEDLFVTDIGSDNVQRYDGATGNFIGEFVGQFPNALDNPRGLVFKDNVLYVANEGGDSVLKFDAQTGLSMGALVLPGSGGLDAPSDIEFGPDGDFYVLSTGTDEILRYDGVTGAFKEVFIGTDSVYLAKPSCFKWHVGAGIGPTVKIADLTIQNGQTTTVNGDSSGIHIDHGAKVYLLRVVVQNNVSSTYGGGIYNYGNLRIDDSDILNNSIPLGEMSLPSVGGGIFNAGQLELMRTLIAHNEAIHGGGIANFAEGYAKITNSTISHNNALGNGGGIWNVDLGTVFINHSTITQNAVNGPGSQAALVRLGGGIYNDGKAEIRLGNSILAENDDNRTFASPSYTPDCFNEPPGKFNSRGHNIFGVVNVA